MARLCCLVVLLTALPGPAVGDSVRSVPQPPQPWARWTTPEPAGGYELLSKGPVLMTLYRQGARVTARSQEGSLVLTVVATVKDGKAAVELIRVQEGADPQRYSALERVPVEYRDKAAALLRLCEKKPAEPSDW